MMGTARHLGLAVGEKVIRRDQSEERGAVIWADGFGFYCRVRWETGSETDETQASLRRQPKN